MNVRKINRNGDEHILTSSFFGIKDLSLINNCLFNFNKSKLIFYKSESFLFLKPLEWNSNQNKNMRAKNESGGFATK